MTHPTSRVESDTWSGMGMGMGVGGSIWEGIEAFWMLETSFPECFLTETGFCQMTHPTSKVENYA